ncbi:GtrA family protein [Clostridium sp. DJ247]|uniref:GtrA family protein n=1 Tax=Clostridium sp. DJ247 TaxID=2726188 RepID=UPI00162850AD|nr:GtrA family protein [Clostridium sp. DJ247]MBC2580458.1 GtrA family protein [Clostridium sp. DJ247]
MKLIKFCIVGGTNTLITLLFFYILNKVLHINYLTSSLISYICGMINSYILNKKWTFHDKDKRVILQFAKFIVVNCISLGINLLVIYMLVNKFYIDSMLSQVFATGFSTISNYVGNRLLVFPHLEQH